MGAGLAYRTLNEGALSARWQELLADRAAPDRCELNEYGDVIEMNPPTKSHQRVDWSMQQQIVAQLGGEALSGIGVLTRIGVRVPDVCWDRDLGAAEPTAPAPAICAEVQSAANTRREIDEKVAAYLAAGAREVILVELSGRVRFFGPEGEREQSSFGLALKLPQAGR